MTKDSTLKVNVRTKPQKIREVKPQLYHGHTTIELKNVSTGSRERIESDNTFTTGIDDFLASLGCFNNSPFANSTWNGRAMYRNLLGGIFLFDKEIEAVNGVYPTVMPAGTKMIANGSYGVTNNGNPTELGSFNSNESSANSTGITMVYDWSTSQGNGDISCVSLTSDTGGYIGYGNSVSQTTHSTKRALDYEQSHQTIGVSEHGRGSTGISGDTVYCVTSVTTSEFVYTKKKYPIISVDFFGEFSQSFTVSLPASMVVATQTPYILYIGNGRFFVIPYKEWASGAAITVGIYDESTQQWSYINFAVPSGGQSYGYPATTTVSVIDGKYFTIVLSSDMSKKLVVGWDGTILSGNRGCKQCELADDLILTVNGYGSYYDRTFPLYIYDRVNDTMYPTNGLSTDMYNIKSFLFDDDGKFFNNGYTAFRNPLFLATVNNIEPVTKTSAQTMKVTYTVTPV